MSNKKIYPLFSLFFIIALVLDACNLPSDAPQGVELNATFAAQTVAAILNASPTATSASGPVSAGASATSTQTPLPTSTNTQAASATPTCPQAQFVTDVTIPDGTVIPPGQGFTKKWRIRNTGQCAWNGYTLVFDSGDAMGGPASQPIGVVNPGQEIDLEVNLTAPNSNGNYRGYWRIVSNTNVLVPILSGYQGKSFYVDIKVQANPTATSTNTPPALPPAIAQVILTTLSGEDGFVNSVGVVNTNPNVGDSNANEAVQAFLSFDMSLIPSSATIVKVVVDFSAYDTLGNPFSLSDNCLRAYSQNFGTLDAGDYFSGAPSGAYIRWCNTGELSSAFEDPDMKTLVQSAVGSSRLQLRIQFTAPNPSLNGTADMVRFGAVKLIVTYQ